MRPPLKVHLANFTGYDSGDLLRFITRGLRACGIRGHVHVTVSTSPIFTRGCADIAPTSKERTHVRRMSLAMASRGRLDMRRAARVLMHECEHMKGKTHEKMPEAMRFSEGPLPAWARGIRIRHRTKAADQMMLLRRRRPPRAHRRATRTATRRS